MSKTVEYRCNLCNGEQDIHHIFGIRWSHEHRFEFQSVDDANTHICVPCYFCLTRLAIDRRDITSSDIIVMHTEKYPE